MLKRVLFYAPVLIAGLLPVGLLPCLRGEVPKVPEKVDKALRARVSEFFQAHVDGSYRKAMDLVADETKDEYFAAGKMKLKSYKVDGIKYSDKFDKATVTTTVTRDWEIRRQNNTVTLPMVTTWKMEHGKWVWYQNKQGAWLTPMGPSDYNAIKPNADGSVTLPKLSQEAILEAGRQIMNSNGVDKLDVFFKPATPGSDQISFRNGAQGAVQLEVTPMDPVPGLTYKFDKLNVNAGETATITFHYEPQSEQKPPPEEVRVPFTVIPFNVTYVALVHFPRQ